MEKICKCCGHVFYPKHHNEGYCSEECRHQRQIELNRQYRSVSEKKKAMKCKTPYVSMKQMVDAMLRLSKKKGRIVQYGEMQRLLITGKVEVRGGVILV